MAVAGTITKTTKNSFDGTAVTISWTADASGDVAEIGVNLNGYLVSMEMAPGTATDAYDLTLLDGDGLDLLNGTGANMSNAAGMTLAEKYYNPLSPAGNYYFFFNEIVYPTIANGGNLGTGAITFKLTRARVK